MYKTVHGIIPDYLTSKFVCRDEITSYRLRSGDAARDSPKWRGETQLTQYPSEAIQ